MTEIAREAAAEGQHQAEFDAFMKANPMDAVFFVKLLSVCDGRIAEGIVLWDAVSHAHQHRRGLAGIREASGASFVAPYGTQHCSVRSFKRAVTDLIRAGFFEEVPQVRNVAKKYFLNWPALAEALANVDMKLPGLRPADTR